MRSRSSLPEAPHSFIAGKDFRPEFLVQGIGHFHQLRGRQRLGEPQHGLGNILKCVTELAFQIFLHAFGAEGLSPLSARNPSSVCFAGTAGCRRATVTVSFLRIFRRCSLTSLGVGWKSPKEMP